MNKPRSCIPAMSYSYQEISLNVMQTSREEDWLTKNEWKPVNYQATGTKRCTVTLENLIHLSGATNYAKHGEFGPV